MNARCFLRAFLLGAVLVNLPPPNPAHVVFEEFGTMAGSVSYMHVTLHINLTHVDNLHKEYTRAVSMIQDHISDLYSKVRQHSGSSNYYETLDRNHLIASNVTTTFTLAADEVKRELDNLRGVLPVDHQYNPGRLIYRESRSVGSQVTTKLAEQILKTMGRRGMSVPTDLLKTIRGATKATKIFRGVSPLSMGFSIAKGIFGTFMGLYNVFQMEKLKRELRGTIEKQNKVIEVLEDHQQQLGALKQDLDEIKAFSKVFDTVRLPALQAQLTRSLGVLRSALKQCIHAVQQAHHHRLAVDYFDPETLSDIYETIKHQAKETKYRLLTRFPSDLFQLEVSYMFDGDDVVLFLHVPMVPEDSLLTLYRLKPFPIPFSESMALLPRPTTTLLALSNRVPRAMMHIDHADLIDCHQVNQIYLCERHGVLQNQIKSSCLGALFEQDIPSAQQACDLELVPYTESVLQLKNNWFLIYSPVMFTAYMQCLNETTDAKPIQIGVQQHYVDPSCHLELKNHSLTSDISMKLDAEITYFPWKLADLSAFKISEDDIKAALEGRTTAGERNLYLADVLQHKHFSSKIPPWTMVISGLAVTATVGLIVLVVSCAGTHRVVTFRRRMRRIRNAVEQIQPIIRSRPASRRPSQHLLPQPPPMYPGLPDENDHAEQYELININQDTLSRSLNRLSRAASLVSQVSKATRRRSVSAPHSGFSSRFSSKLDFASARTDDDVTDFDEEFDRPRSQGASFIPTPKPRAVTPSYAFLKATVDE